MIYIVNKSKFYRKGCRTRKKLLGSDKEILETLEFQAVTQPLDDLLSSQSHYITQNFIAGRYELMTIAFDDFIDYNMGVRIIKLDKENWVNSKCSSG